MIGSEREDFKTGWEEWQGKALNWIFMNMLDVISKQFTVPETVDSADGCNHCNLKDDRNCAFCNTCIFTKKFEYL